MAFELARQLAHKGHKVHIITNKSNRPIPEPGLTIHHLPARGFWQAAVRSLLELESVGDLDVIHIQNLVIHRAFAPFMGVLRRRCRLPVVAYCCQIPGLAFSSWVDVLKKDPSEAVFNKLGMLAPSFATQWTIRTIDKTIASTKFIKNELSSAHPLREIGIIPPFFNDDRLRQSLKVSSGKSPNRQVLYLGSHKVLRGEDDFLSMLGLLRKQYPDLQGIAVTTDPIPRRIRRLIRTQNLNGAVRFLSRGVDIDVPSLMTSVNLYAFTGLSPIGSIDPPLSVIESLILGTPVVSYDTGGISEILDQDNLVPYRDYVSLARRASKFLDGEEGVRPRPDLLSRFSSDRASARFEEAYQELARS